MMNIKSFLIILLVTSSQTFAHEIEEKDYIPSLITDTPSDGRKLAAKIVKNTLMKLQPSEYIREKTRIENLSNPVTLMKEAELIALEFNTIALANNYWRDAKRN